MLHTFRRDPKVAERYGSICDFSKKLHISFPAWNSLIGSIYYDVLVSKDVCGSDSFVIQMEFDTSIHEPLDKMDTSFSWFDTTYDIQIDSSMSYYDLYAIVSDVTVY